MTTAHLTVVATEAEADILCAMLRNEGIPCSHRPTHLSDRRLVWGWHEVLVDDADLERAGAYLPEPDKD